MNKLVFPSGSLALNGYLLLPTLLAYKHSQETGHLQKNIIQIWLTVLE